MIKNQVLIIMDDPEISQSLQARLEKLSIETDCVSPLSKALKHAMKKSYCLLVIDLQMFHIGSMELVKILRIARHAPILAFPEALQIQEKIDLFHVGVDVFLEKPINVDICVAQVNALIGLFLGSDKDLGRSIPIAFGTSLVIAPQYRQVLVQGEPLELTRIEFDLLYFMAKHPGQVFSRKELYGYVWDDLYDLGGDETAMGLFGTLPVIVRSTAPLRCKGTVLLFCSRQ